MAKYKLGICEIYNPTRHMRSRQRTFTYSILSEFYGSSESYPRVPMQYMMEAFMLLNNYMVILK